MEPQERKAQERIIPTIVPPQEIQAPKSAVEISASEVVTQKPDVVYRKYDSEDMVRLRGPDVIQGLESGNRSDMRVNSGMMQKVSICTGVKSCPWFSDVVDERTGVTDDLFNKRFSVEYRKIPVEEADRLWKEVQQYNTNTVNLEDLRKK